MLELLYSDHSPDFGRDMRLRNSCGLRPQVNMAASGYELAFCDYKNVVGFTHNQLWRPMAANSKVSTVGYPKNGQGNYARVAHFIGSVLFSFDDTSEAL